MEYGKTHVRPIWPHVCFRVAEHNLSLVCLRLNQAQYTCRKLKRPYRLGMGVKSVVFHFYVPLLILIVFLEEILFFLFLFIPNLHEKFYSSYEQIRCPLLELRMFFLMLDCKHLPKHSP